jgi:hypothetical protein
MRGAKSLRRASSMASLAECTVATTLTESTTTKTTAAPGQRNRDNGGEETEAVASPDLSRTRPSPSLSEMEDGGDDGENDDNDDIQMIEAP